MKEAIKGLKPESLWNFFYGLNQIPRESKHEKGAIEWIASVAKKLGLPYKIDKVGNIVVSKPASKGKEKATPVVLQGHVDMVCEKNAGVIHDFSKDPIELVRDGEYIRAAGTTLGADNGIGVAAALSVLADKSLIHPPLEALFTIDEETGLTGAVSLEPGFVQGKILLNCDSEEDGVLFVGCAGGKNTEVTFDIDWQKAPVGLQAVAVKITGLRGGHSGLEIHQGHANAVKELNRVIWKAAEKLKFSLFYNDGGTKHNAIPRDAEYRLLIDKKSADILKQFVADSENILKNEFKQIEPNLKLSVEVIPNYPENVFSPEFQNRLLNFLYAIPHGVRKMSPDIPGLVETSTNAAIVHTQDNQISLLTSQRSSVASEIVEIADKVKAIGLLAGGKVKQDAGYPAWAPNMQSKILSLMKSTHKDLFGKEPDVQAIHAGLECGIIGEKCEGMDMISFGPTLKAVHSPDERAEIATVEKFWQLLLEVLKRIE